MRSILISMAFVLGLICSNCCSAQSLDWANTDSAEHFGLSPNQDATIQCEGGTCRLLKLGRGRAEPVANVVPVTETISPAVVHPVTYAQQSIPVSEYVPLQPSGECLFQRGQPVRNAGKAVWGVVGNVKNYLQDNKPIRSRIFRRRCN